MVERWADARLVWTSDVQIPNGMAGDGRSPGRDGEHFISGGFGSPILAEGKVFVQYYVPSGEAWQDMLARHGETYKAKFLMEADDVLHCFDAATGKTAWRKVLEKTSMNMQCFTKGGPSLTPCFAGGRVYMHVNGGRVFCLDVAKKGDVVWEYKTARHEYQEKIRKLCREKKQAICYNRDYKTSPVAVGGVVVFNDTLHHKTMVGGTWQTHYENASNLVGLDAATGKELWKLPNGASNGGNPAAWTHQGKGYVIATGGDRVVRCIEPANGKVLWEQPSGDGLTVAVDGEYMVCGGGSGEGKAGWHVGYRISPEGAKEIWQVKAHGRPGLAWPAAAGGHMYCESSPRGKLVCVELATGKVSGTAAAAKESHFGYFPRVMGGRVVCGGADSDQLHLYTADPRDFRLLDDATIANAWGYEMPMMPALADGRMYWRTHDRLVCIDLRAGAKGVPLGGSSLLPSAASAIDAKRPAKDGGETGAAPKPPAPPTGLDGD
jgi:outer membrane protein assembly factor BamB